MAPYKWTLALVLVCILVTSVATVAGSKSLQYVVDDYIRPLLQMDAPDLGPLFRFLCIMAAVYVAGILSSFLYNYLMVQVAQGVQRTSGISCFPTCSGCPSATLTPIPTAI